MFGILLAAILPLALYGIARFAGGPRPNLFTVLLGGYAARLALQLFIRDVPLFSHGVGGDYFGYEGLAVVIAKIWEHGGIQYFTAEDLPAMGPTSLPPNLFAVVIYLNGSPTSFGCTAVVAFCAALTCLNVYRLAVDLGADEPMALRVSAILLFSPAFLFYTSDMYKDGLVLFLITGALGSALRLARGFSALHVVIGVVSLLGLWYVRFYLVFVAVVPLLVGLSGFGSRSFVRPLFAALLGALALLILATATGFLEQLSETGSTTFAVATSDASLESNAATGSGVTFDDGGSAFGSLGPKILYTLFSPFPWQSGSIGLQLGKLEVLPWYYLLYRGWLSGRRLWKQDPALILMFLSFLVPTTIMYATIMTNIGLIVRERMGIVMIGAVLAMLSWPAKEEVSAPEPGESSEHEPEVA